MIAKTYVLLCIVSVLLLPTDDAIVMLFFIRLQVMPYFFTVTPFTTVVLTRVTLEDGPS